MTEDEPREKRGRGKRPREVTGERERVRDGEEGEFTGYFPIPFGLFPCGRVGEQREPQEGRKDRV